jgi:hypothetical protein
VSTHDAYSSVRSRRSGLIPDGLRVKAGDRAGL